MDNRKRRTFARAAVLAACLTLANGASGAPGCDYRQAPCQAERLAAMDRLYGVQPAERLAADKVQSIRAYFIDAWGRDRGFFALERRPGDEPRMIARFDPDEDPRPARNGLSAPLPLAEWDRVWSESAQFDRPLAPIAVAVETEAGTEIRICSDSWTAAVEMIDAKGRVRRAWETACNAGLAYDAARRIAAAALAAEPVCALLERPASEAVRTLDDCRRLAGDRAAAAQAFNVLHKDWMLYPNDAESAPAIRQYFDDAAELNWPGEAPVHGARAAALAWASHGHDGNFFPALIFGETADRVRMEGVIALSRGEHETKPRTAKTVMIWERKNGFDFRLVSLRSETPPPVDDDGH
jgi:hypothetical protein